MQAGVAAPSADNHHCFEFQLTADGIGLFGNGGYFSAPFHRRVLDRISLGAVVENMIIRATRLGYGAEPHWLPDPIEQCPIVELRLRKGEPREVGLDSAIPTRHANRSVMFYGPRLGETGLASFKALIEDIPGVGLFFCDSERLRSELLRLVWRAETERFCTHALHQDLFSAVRFDVGWHASAQVGLPPAALGVEAGLRWAFGQLRHWPLMNVLRHLGMHHALGFRAAYLPCRLAPHVGVLTTSLPLEQGAVAVGRALQRIWLEAERRGLAFQPLAGAALLALPEYEDVRPATGVRLRDGWKVLTEVTPLMVFRLGHAKPPEVRTGRPPWQDLLRA